MEKPKVGTRVHLDGGCNCTLHFHPAKCLDTPCDSSQAKAAWVQAGQPSGRVDYEQVVLSSTLCKQPRQKEDIRVGK
jgi:hypothetical protein